MRRIWLGLAIAAAGGYLTSTVSVNPRLAGVIGPVGDGIVVGVVIFLSYLLHLSLTAPVASEDQTKG